jgi:hypothetical protein
MIEKIIDIALSILKDCIGNIIYVYILKGSE